MTLKQLKDKIDEVYENFDGIADYILVKYSDIKYEYIDPSDERTGLTKLYTDDGYLVEEATKEDKVGVDYFVIDG